MFIFWGIEFINPYTIRLMTIPRKNNGSLERHVRKLWNRYNREAQLKSRKEGWIRQYPATYRGHDAAVEMNVYDAYSNNGRHIV